MRPIPGICFVGILLALSSACSPPRKVAVEERRTVDARQEAEAIGGEFIRIVQPGDTLYGIAFAHGLDPKVLARWNQMRDTDALHVGRRLRLTAPLNQSQPTANKPVAVVKPPATSPPVQTRPQEVSKPAARPKPVQPIGGTTRWNWPTNGQVIARFSSRNGQQGIDIQGQVGQPVLAAADGEVVYVGNGLKGYGNLVIIKHPQDFLSAYAHNRETFVREGEQVRQKQRIASLGKNKQRQHALHFQIRRHGEPVDPLKYLPNI